jgi:hypothetical protein
MILGWKQEQGLYYPDEFDAAFVPIFLQMIKVQQRALLVLIWQWILYLYGTEFF